MIQKINPLKLVGFIIYLAFILSNGALIFEDLYRSEDKAVALTIYVLSMILLIAAPTYYVAKSSWLKR